MCVYVVILSQYFRDYSDTIHKHLVVFIKFDKALLLDNNNSFTFGKLGPIFQNLFYPKKLSDTLECHICAIFKAVCYPDRFFMSL